VSARWPGFNRNHPRKTIFLTLAIAAFPLVASAQGKVTFGNDANHMVMIWSRYAPYYPGVLIAAPQVGTPNDVMSSLTAQLCAGPSPDSLTLQYTMAPAGFTGLADGRLKNASVTLTGIAEAQTGYFQILIWETSAGSYAAAQTGRWWSGSTPVFSGSAGGFAPTPLASMASWSPDLIILYQPIPEPSALALAGLSVALWLILHRRK